VFPAAFQKQGAYDAPQTVVEGPKPLP